MARVQKNDKKHKETVVSKPQKEKKASVAVTQKSEKGELFFKIVTYVIIGVILAVVIWLIVAALIKDEEKTALYEPQIVTLDDVKKIDTDEESSISNAKLKAALLNKDSIHFIFFNREYETLEDGSLKDRFTESKKLIDNILAKGTASEKEEDKGYVSFDHIAVFVVDMAASEGYLSYLQNLSKPSESENPALNYTSGPMLLTYDISVNQDPIIPVTYGGFTTKLQTIIDSFK